MIHHPHLSALEVRFSRRCAIQIDVYLYLYHTTYNFTRLQAFLFCFTQSSWIVSKAEHVSGAGAVKISAHRSHLSTILFSLWLLLSVNDIPPSVTPAPTHETSGTRSTVFFHAQLPLVQFSGSLRSAVSSKYKNVLRGCRRFVWRNGFSTELWLSSTDGRWAEVDRKGIPVFPDDWCCNVKPPMSQPSYEFRSVALTTMSPCWAELRFYRLQLQNVG